MPRIMTDFLDDAVKTHPNKAAFTEEARSLTYKELQEEAYRIAMPIIKSGFRKKPVALYFDKSIYCISSMMAVAYSGNFYSVIDTEMPVERINKIFEVLEPELVLTDRKHFENAKEPMELHATRAIFSFVQLLKTYFPHVFTLAGTVTSAMAV